MSLINFGGGLSAAGQSISTFAGQAGIAQQKADLEKQQAVQADQLATTRETTLAGVQGDQARQTATTTAQAQGAATIATQEAANKLPLSAEQTATTAAESKNAEAHMIEAKKPVPGGFTGSFMVPDSTAPGGYKLVTSKVNGADLSDDSLDRMADQALAGDKSVFTGLGSGNVGSMNKAALADRITKRGQERGIGGADIAAINAQFVGTQAGERALGTRSANIGMASQEFKMMAPLSLEASAKVDRTQYPTLNAVIEAAEKGTGGDDVTRLGVATNSLVNIYARAINPTGTPTDSDKAHARDILDKAYAKGQYSAAVDQMQQEIGAALKAPGAVRDELRGAITGKQDNSSASKAAADKPQTTGAPKPGAYNWTPNGGLAPQVPTQ